MIIPTKLNSIRGKVVALVLAVSTLALLLASTMFVANGVEMARSSKAQQLTALAQLIASNSTAALSFGEVEAAAELLATLNNRPTIQYTCLLDDLDEAFATYRRDEAVEFAPTIPTDFGHTYANGRLDLLLPVIDDGERIGAIYLMATLEDLNQQFSANLIAVFLAMALALAVASVLTLRLEKFISEPILQLAATAKSISEEGNYAIRVEHRASDEIGELYSGFNQMLDEIERGETQLRDAHDQLEARVAQRTDQLSQANDQLKREMHERQEMNNRMVELSHQAGKAEVATGVLHNVGNVLNSINVSANLVEEALRTSRIPSLKKATELMREQSDLATFITQDERGKVLPDFLARVSDKICEERDGEARELASLIDHLEHVKTIVAMQQSYAGVSGLLEPIFLPKLIDDAELLNASSLNKHEVEVVREIEDLPEVMVEKQKLAQILVNLLKNAKDALTESRTEGRRLVVKIYRHGEDRLRIATTDNGVGIAPENLTKIFSHGFTTKETGHGFGLHSCANAAREMGGTLTVESDGLGHGATFLIDLPYQPACNADSTTPSEVLV